MKLNGKTNADGSYSVSIRLSELLMAGFVPYRNESDPDNVHGYQRFESGSIKRGNDIASYIRLCIDNEVPPELFDLKCNARVQHDDFRVTAIKGADNLVTLELPDVVAPSENEPEDGQYTEPYIAIIDGGTRFIGYRFAQEAGYFTTKDGDGKDVDTDPLVDLWLYVELSEPREALRFTLINSRQKLVRADLADRILQTVAEEIPLDDKDSEEYKELSTLEVKDKAWKYIGNRISAKLNADEDSVWHGMIQMPTITNEVDPTTGLPKLPEVKTLKLLGMTVAQRPFYRSALWDKGILNEDRLFGILKNAGRSLRSVNEDAFEAPKDSFLLSAAGTAAFMGAVCNLVEYKQNTEERPNFTSKWFTALFEQTILADYDYWYRGGQKNANETRPSGEPYPTVNGPAVNFTGGGQIQKHIDMLWHNMLEQIDEKAARVLGGQLRTKYGRQAVIARQERRQEAEQTAEAAEEMAQTGEAVGAAV